MRTLKLSELSEEEKKILQNWANAQIENNKNNSNETNTTNNTANRLNRNGFTARDDFKNNERVKNAKVVKSDNKINLPGIGKAAWNTYWDTVGYLGKEAGVGALGAVAGLQDEAAIRSAAAIEEGQRGQISNPVSVIANLPSINPLGFGAKYATNMINKIANGDFQKQGVGKTVLQGVASATDSLTGWDIVKPALQTLGKTNEAEEIKNNILNSSQWYKDVNNQMLETRSKQAPIMQTLGEGASSVGRMLPTIGLSAVTGNPNIGLTAMATSAAGTSSREALDKGLDLETAKGVGDIKGYLEYATEQLFGGDYFSAQAGRNAAKAGTQALKKFSVDDAVKKLVSEKVKSKAGQFLWSKGYELGGEVMEEWISDTLGNFVDLAATGEYPGVEELFKNGGKTAVSTILSTLMLNALGLGGGTYQEIQQLNLNKQQQTEINKLVEEITKKVNPRQQAEQEIQNSKLDNTNKQEMLSALNNMQEVTDQDVQDIKNNINEINKVVNEQNKLPTNGNYKFDNTRKQTYAKYKNDTNNYNSAVVNEVLDTVPTNKNGKRTVAQWTNAANEIGQRIANLSNEEIERIAYKSWFDVQPTKAITQYDRESGKNVGFSPLNSDTWVNNIYDGVNKARANGVQTQVQEEVKLPMAEKYNKATEVNLPKNRVVIDETDNLVTSAKKYGGTFEHISIENAQKALDKRGIKGRFDESYFTNANEGGKYILTTDNNGNVVSREIVLNPHANEKTIMQEMAIHELSHDIFASKTQESQELYNAMKEYLEQDPNFAKYKNQLAESYLQIKDQNGNVVYSREQKGFDSMIEEEAVAKALQKKFGTQEEINRLVGEKPNIAQRIYDWVKTKIQDFKNRNDAEYQFWKDVQNKFEKAYNQEGQYKNAESIQRHYFNNVANFDETEYNSIESKRISSSKTWKSLKDTIDSAVKNREIYPGVNEIVLYDYGDETYKNYTIYYKDIDNWKIIEEENVDDFNGGNNDSVRFAINTNERDGRTRSNEANYKWNNEQAKNGEKATSNVGLPFSNQRDTNTNRNNNTEINRNQKQQRLENIENSNKSSIFMSKNRTIQGLENYNVEELKQGLKGDIQQILEDNDLYDIDIVDLDLHGSRLRGTAKANSDLDVVVQYNGDIREDTLFDILNENPIEIDGVKVDINPIQEDIKSYMERSNKYDQEILSKNNKTNEKYSISTDGAMQDNKTGKKVILDAESNNNGKNLLAIHNLSEDKLKAVLDLGGFPVPSIAITNPDINSHEQFGDISVIFNKETINPSNRANEVYDRDVWSPVVPEINYDINNADIKEYITKNLDMDRKDSIVNDAITRYLYDTNLADMVNRAGEKRTLDLLKDSKELQYLYMKTIENPDYKPQMKIKDLSNYYSNESLQRFVNEFNNTHDMPFSDFFYHYINYKDMEISAAEESKLKKEIQKAIRPEIEEYYDKYNKSKDNKIPQKAIEKAIQEELDNAIDTYGRYYDFLMNASYLEKNGISEVIDEQKTLDNVTNEINKEEYNKWIDDTFGRMFKDAKKGIRNNKDPFTASGNRRSFNQLYDEYNLENLVKTLTKGKTQAAQKTFFEGGFGKTAAELATRFNSINDIKNNQNKLTSSEEIKPIIEEMTQKYNDDLHELVDYYKHSDYGTEIASYMQAFEDVQAAAFEFAGKKNLTIENFRKVLDSFYRFDTKSIPDAKLQTIIDDLQTMKNIPTDYFEAKPQRAVGFDEIDVVIVPNDMNTDLKQQLKNMGIKIIEYNPNNETERSDILKSLDEYKFNKTSESFDEYLTKRIGKEGTRTTFKELFPTKETTKLPTKQEIVKQEPIKQVQESSNEGSIKMPMNENAKFRKHYKSIIESSNTTPEAKAIAKELMGSDTYIPESNNKQLERADERISIAGADSELDSLLSRSMTGGNIKADDIAVGERLIQYYSKSGNKAKLAEAIQATSMAGTAAGQTVQAMSLLNHQTPQGQAVWLQRSVDKMNNDLRKARGTKAEQFDLTPEMIDKIVNSENETELHNNLNEVYEELGQQVSKSMSQKVDAWRYFSMLANPRTHVRNIVGNMAMAKVQGAKNKVAGAIEGVVSKFNPEMERTHTIKPASKEVKAFAKADIENVADRLELNENKYNPKTRLENSMKTFKNDTLEKTIGKMFKLNDSALAAEDGWGLKAGYRKALAEYMTANNLTPDNITDAQLAKARNYAVEQAKEATFHQESVIATAINQISNKNKFTKFLADATLPFKKTPINVAKAGVQYSPVGLAKSMVYDVVQLRKGNITVNQYIDNVSKGLTGTGIALIGYALAEAGILKADGDDDDKEGFEEDRGHQKYAITIGDNTYKLDWLAPSGIPLFIGAKTNELMKQSKEKKSSSSDDESGYQQAIDAATSILDAFTNAVDPMTEMSMLSGLSSTLKSYDNNLFAGVIVNMGKSYVNQFVPTALGQVAKTADEYERSTTSTKTGTLPKAIDMTKNQIMSKVPGLRQMLPTKTDTWGNDQKQAENIVQRGLENAVLPWTRKAVSSTKVDKELEQLYEDTGEKTVLPSALNKNMTINKEKYTLTSKEMADYKKQYGQDSYNLLNKLISDKAYKELSDEQKQKAVEKVYEYAKEAVKLDYAKNAKLPLAESTLTKSVNSLNDKTDYFVYLALTQGMTKDSEKIKTLIDADMTNASKKSIFESGFKDSRYDALKETGINITEYLKYKLQDFSADKKDDGTVSGKSISGSGKEKAMNYINNMNITYEQKLLLAGMDYALSSNEKSNIVSYVKGLKVSEDKKLEILNKVNGITVYKDGRVTWK